MIESAEKLWLDGELVDWDAGSVHLLTHTLHYGFGAFEGIRAYAQEGGGVALFQLDGHLARFFASAAAISVDVPYDAAALARACHQVVSVNGLRDAYVRPLLFVGEPNIIFAHWLNRVRVAVVAFPWRGYSDRNREEGTTAKVSPYVRPRVHAEFYKAKLCGHYALSVAAYSEAVRTGFKQAIFLDEEGMVCETTGENLFIVREGELWTPPSSRSILLGLTRAAVLELARDSGIATAERDFGVEELKGASEVFTTGTASELLPICAIDGSPVGDGRLGPVTRLLQERFQAAATGRLTSHRSWLTPLEPCRAGLITT
jgi:branched-chain amino acid aminotransferase